MVEAFEIGVSLALRDGVSEGIAAAKRDMESVESAIASGSLSMQRLQQAAAAAMGIAPVDTTRRQDPAEPKSGNIAETQISEPRREPPLDQPRPGDLRAPREGVEPPHHIFAAQPSPADGPGVSTVQAVPKTNFISPAMHSQVREVAGSAAPAPDLPRAVLNDAGPTTAMLAAVGGANSIKDQALGMAPGTPAGSFVTHTARAAREQADPLIIPAGAAESVDDPQPGPTISQMPPQVGAPWAQHVGRARRDAQDSARPFPVGPSAPFERVREGGNDGGDVYLDGALVGRWLSRFLAHEASRSSVGPTGFDARRHPLMPGSSVGA